MTLHLAFSLLMFHPYAPLLSDNLFDTARQSLIFTELLQGLFGPKSAGPVHFRISEDDLGHIANFSHSTGHEPNRPDKMVPADDDPTPINDPDHDSICDFSKNNTREHWMVRCSYSVKVHTQPNTLKSGDRNLLKRKEPGNSAEKAKEKVFGNKKQENESSHIDKPLETKAEWWQKQKSKSC